METVKLTKAFPDSGNGISSPPIRTLDFAVQSVSVSSSMMDLTDVSLYSVIRIS